MQKRLRAGSAFRPFASATFVIGMLLTSACQSVGSVPPPTSLHRIASNFHHTPKGHPTPTGRPTTLTLRHDPAPPAPTQVDAIGEHSSLDELLARALRLHPELLAQNEREVAESERAKLVRSFDDPRLSVRWFLEEIETRTGPQEWAVGIQQALPGWGKRSRRGRAAMASADSERARERELRAALTYQVVRVWCELFYLERAREVLSENKQLIERLGEIVRTRYAVGEASYSDLTRTNIELAQTRSQLEDVIDRARPLRAEMNALLARDSEAPLPRPTELGANLVEPAKLRDDAMPDATLLAELLEGNPTLRRLRSQREAADARRALADIAARPDFQVGLEYIATGDPLNPATPGAGDDPLLASLSFNLPLQSARYRAMKRQSRAEVRSATSALEARSDRVRADLEQELYAWREARRLVKLHSEA